MRAELGGRKRVGLEEEEIDVLLDVPHQLHDPCRERLLYGQPTGPSPLNHRDGVSRPALRHGSLNSLFQVALDLPSWTIPANEGGRVSREAAREEERARMPGQVSKSSRTRGGMRQY